MKFLLSLCYSALFIGGIYSCTDQEGMADIGVNKNNGRITQRSPTTVGDRVYFAAFNDFKDYYLDLDAILSTYNGD